MTFVFHNNGFSIYFTQPTVQTLSVMPPQNTELVTLPPPTFPTLRAARHSKDERLNTWLFNRRLSGEWAYQIATYFLQTDWSPFLGIANRRGTPRLKKRVSPGFSDMSLRRVMRIYCLYSKRFLRQNPLATPTPTMRSNFLSVMSWLFCDPNRDQRNLREETTDLWLRKRRAQQLILRRDHHLFDFFFVLHYSGRWK